MIFLVLLRIRKHLSAYVTLDESHEMAAAVPPPKVNSVAVSHEGSCAAAISNRCIALGSGNSQKQNLLYSSRALMAAAAAMSSSQILV